MFARIVVCLLLTVFLLTVSLAEAQQPANVRRIGYLTNTVLFADQELQFDAIRQGMRDLGYVEGQNIVIESRSGEGKTDRQRAVAAELVRLKVDAIVAGGTGDIRAAKEATSKIPI